ncbi:MAG: hypothetical protein ACREPX_13860 [Rhodanobacteraceae bacterium]
MATKKTVAKRGAPRAKKKAPSRKRAPKKAPPRKVARKKTAPRKSARKRPAAKKAARQAPRKSAAAKAATTAKRRAAAKPSPVRKKAPAKRPATSRVAASAPKLDTSQFPCGDDALREATGRSWQEWLQLLDKAGASAGSFDRQQLHDLAMQWVPGSDGWWGHVVSTGYESARGLKEKPAAKSFRASISKTLPVPLFAAFAAWADQTLRRGWLDAAGLDFTRLNAGRDIRARWPDGSVLKIRFDSTAPDQCEIVVDASKLADAAAVERAKTFWQEQFERLQAYLRI